MRDVSTDLRRMTARAIAPGSLNQGLFQIVKDRARGLPVHSKSLHEYSTHEKAKWDTRSKAELVASRIARGTYGFSLLIRVRTVQTVVTDVQYWMRGLFRALSILAIPDLSRSFRSSRSRRRRTQLYGEHGFGANGG